MNFSAILALLKASYRMLGSVFFDDVPSSKFTHSKFNPLRWVLLLIVMLGFIFDAILIVKYTSLRTELYTCNKLYTDLINDPTRPPTLP